MTELITLLILVTILLTILIGLRFGGIIYNRVAEFNKAEEELKAKEEKVSALFESQKELLQVSKNAYASLSFADLDKLLIDLYNRILTLESTSYISENDHDAKSKLYIRSTEALINFLGENTIKAIDSRFSENFIYKWCEMRFRTLEHDGVLNKIITKKIYPNE